TSNVNKSSSPTDNSKQQDTPPTTNIQSTLEPTTPTNVNAEENNDNQAEDAHFQPYEFVNLFCTPTKDHPLTQVRGNPFKPVQTRQQLITDPEMYMFALTMSTPEPKNIKEAMANSAWIEAMQDELHYCSLRSCSDFRRLCCTQVFSNLSNGRENGIFNGPLKEEVYVSQPDRFVDPDHLEKVYRLRKALYGLKQALRAWYDELLNFLMSKGFTKGTINPTLFMITYGKDILLVQIYVDDIIFGSTNLKFSKRFEKLMHSRFEMSLMGEMKFFLGLQIHQSPIDLSGKLVDQIYYRSKIGSLMYLTYSRPDIVQEVCYCARYQARPIEKHLKEVKRIFRYLRGTINMGLWYPKDSGFELTAFSNANHTGCLDTRKSTSRGIQFLGDKLVSWMSKKQDYTAMSLTEAEYVALSASCAQVMWIRTQLNDYGFNYNKISLYCDSQSAISISCNPMQHSRTKHIHTRYHFIKEQVENGIIEFYFVRTEYQLGDMFTKALPKDRFQYLVKRIGMRCLTSAELEVLANESA
ncbi:retrovirus-related pol polyprotein from transposon TNT 1-94, partial [Tanacetum coccineum]